MEMDNSINKLINKPVNEEVIRSAGQSKQKLSDDAVDGIAALVLITLIVTVVCYWLETM